MDSKLGTAYITGVHLTLVSECALVHIYIYIYRSAIPLHVAVKLICFTIGLLILLSKDLIINLYELCSCHCCCCVIHNNNNMWLLLSNTQQQQQHNTIIKRLTEIFYRNKCMTDLSSCSTPNDHIYKVTTYIKLHRM